MKSIEHRRGLDLAGIIIIYVVTSYLIFSSFSLGTLGGGVFAFVILILSIITLILTILYHTRRIQNHVIIGVLGLIFGLIIGGIFILVANKK